MNQSLPSCRCRQAVLFGLLICALATMAGAQTLSIDDVVVMEGDVGTVSAVFTVSLSAVTPLQVSVKW